MNTNVRTIADINARLQRGEAVVLSAHQLKEGLRAGRRYALQDIDVVTTATRGVMSGTAAMLTVPVAERGVFARAAKAWLNGVEGSTGPAPNERLGYVDLMVYGTAPSRDAPQSYGGGHLFRDLIEGKEILIEVISEEGKAFSRRFTLDELNFARMYCTRNASMNHLALGAFKAGPSPSRDGVSVAGCGELNPIQNDPRLRTIGIGTRVLVNDAHGLVVAAGTGATAERPNLALVADLFHMNPRYVGGFAWNGGLDVLNSVAVPIPVLDETVLEGICRCLDENISLPLVDPTDGSKLGESRYAAVWQGRSLEIDFDPARRCAQCAVACVAETLCPTQAIAWRDARIDRERCSSCGACVSACPNGAFRAELGEIEALGRRWPISLRLSDRKKAMELAERLKDRLISGEFRLAEAVAPVSIKGATGDGQITRTSSNGRNN